jgi:hypothetical protein
VLGVLQDQCPTLVMSQVCGIASGGHTPPPCPVALVPDGEQSNMSTRSVLQVLLVELHKGLMGNPLQCIVHVVTFG